MPLYLLFSEYCLATSATASLILFLTVRSVSLAKVSNSFCLMTVADSAPRETKTSAFSPFSVLRVFDAIRRKITAEKERSLYQSQNISMTNTQALFQTLTGASLEFDMCSAKPSSRYSGRVLTQEFCRYSSAWVRIALSEDCRAWRVCVNSLYVSVPSIDMLTSELRLPNLVGVSSTGRNCG